MCFEVAVGKEPGLASSGYVQVNLPLEPSKTYFSTVRGVTNGGNLLETSSDGFTVEQTPPTEHIDSTVLVTWLGKPDIISVWAENSVGLVSIARTGTVVIDKTAPKAGTVLCPAFIQASVPLVCTWTGFVDTKVAHQGIQNHDGTF
ncbi:uncharacterized protein LOC144618303 [Crassostrea virginica]